MQSLSTYKNANMDDKENNMSFGKNLQYLRQLSKNMTQEALAEKLNVSRQTISKWEMDAANPEMEKALEICKIFKCSLDNLFREEMDKRSDSYSNLRVEEVAGFQYIEHTVISTDPESDAISRMYKTAEENGIENPKVIGWDFPNLSQEQINVFNMHTILKPRHFGFIIAITLVNVDFEGIDFILNSFSKNSFLFSP